MAAENRNMRLALGGWGSDGLGRGIREHSRMMSYTNTSIDLLKSYGSFTSKEKNNCSDWCGSGDWTLSHKLNGHWVNSQSGHMPRLQVQPPVTACGRGNQSMFLSHTDVSLPVFLLPSLKNKSKNKSFF